MKHAALLILLLPAAVACGAPPPRPPMVTVGDSPAEIDRPTPAPVLPAIRPVDEVVVDEGLGPRAAQPGHPSRGAQQGLLLTDGEGHRFSVETIRTISPPVTR